MAQSPLTYSRNKDGILNSKLNRLEKGLLKDTAHLRRHQEEMADIQLLFVEKKIDKDHAEILARKSTEVYEAKEAKRKDPEGIAGKKRIGKYWVDKDDPLFNPDMSLPWYKRWFSWT